MIKTLIQEIMLNKIKQDLDYICNRCFSFELKGCRKRATSVYRSSLQVLL